MKICIYFEQKSQKYYKNNKFYESEIPVFYLGYPFTFS